MSIIDLINLRTDKIIHENITRQFQGYRSLDDAFNVCFSWFFSPDLNLLQVITQTWPCPPTAGANFIKRFFFITDGEGILVKKDVWNSTTVNSTLIVLLCQIRRKEFSNKILTSGVSVINSFFVNNGPYKQARVLFHGKLAEPYIQTSIF